MARRCKGEGSIYKRADGRWCGAYYDEGYNRCYVYGKTQTEVKKKLKEKMGIGVVKVQGKNYILQEWVSEFLEKYKRNELKISTFDSYMITYRKHIKDSTIGKKRLDHLKSTDLQNYYNMKIKSGYSSKTVRTIEVILNGALEMAYKLRMIPENPNHFTTIPKKIKYEAQVLTMADVNKIVSEAKAEELYPIVVTTVYTGMRRGEIMALKWQNVDFEQRKIFVKNSLCRVEAGTPDEAGRHHFTYKILEPKTKKSIRMIPMMDEVYEALLEQKKRQDEDKEKYAEIYTDQDFVFADSTGNYLPQRAFSDKYKSFLQKYDIPEIRFHDLRHTFASLLIESDVSMKVVQELLGHSTISTSMDIYTHISMQKKEQAMERLTLKKAEKE